MRPSRIVVAVALACLCLVASAGDAALESPYWDVRHSSEGIVPILRLGGGAQILCGRTKNGVAVEVTVLEGDSEREPAAWTSELQATWAKEGRTAAASVQSDRDGVLLFSEPGLGGAPRRHAYRIRARGVHAFVLHAVGKTGDDAALRVALDGFAIGERRGACIAGLAEALDSGEDPSSPRIALAALRRYLPDEGARPAIAAQIASHAILNAPAGTISADEMFAVCLRVGLAFLTDRRIPQAVEWLDKARARTSATSRPAEALSTTLYNLACAHALGGDKDKAFATIGEIVAAGEWADAAEWAQEDPDLESLRSDPRWEKLPKADVK